MILAALGHDFTYEMECIARLFFPGSKIKTVKANNITINNEFSPVNYNNFTGENVMITHVIPFRCLSVHIKFDDFEKSITEEITEDCDLEYLERRLGFHLFMLLCEHTGKRPSWGILTGIRPVRLCGKWSEDGLSDDQIRKRLTEDYLVISQKAELCMKTGKAQKRILTCNAPDSFSLYIGIPFCPTRCLYCSFVSHAIGKTTKLVPDYVRLLCDEIRFTGKIAKELGLRLQTIYIGGGTPTALSVPQLSQILTAVKESFDFSDLREYTVEAGRPDTITEDKLVLLRDFSVDRISINPQSMNDDVLTAIGRAHSSKQIEESFALARQIGFSAINMDLIAGLPLDSVDSFAKSLDKVVSFAPENITIHALTVKRSSDLRGQGDAFLTANPETGNMLGYSSEKLGKSGYFPYYLYRQKATIDNLENVGYTVPGHESMYNIFSMDDAHNILAVGAGAVSKLCFGNGGVRRIFNYKYPYEYISRFSEILGRKGALHANNY